MKIMLISLPVPTAENDNMFPLGIGYLVSSLKPFHDVKSYHFNNLEIAKKEIIQKCISFKPVVIGFTCNSFIRGSVRVIIKLIKSMNVDIKIIVGGVHATYCYEQMLNDYGADFVVIGEGESTLLKLCDAIEQKKSIYAINGIAFRDNQSIQLNPAVTPIANLDDLPMPNFEYVRKNIHANQVGYVITSRGCPVRCSFCSTSSYWGQKMRMKSVQRVVNEIESLISNFNIKTLYFHDDTFNLGTSRVLNICKEIKNRGLCIEWGCNARVKPVSEDMIAGMVDAGCRHICWGVESGSEEILQKIKKNISLIDIQHAFEISKKFSDILGTGAFTMVGNPGESEKTVQETIDFLNTIHITDAPSTAVLYVLPGTLQYETFKNQGYIHDADWSRYDTVPFYTIEHSYRTLSKWAKQISQSGMRIKSSNPLAGPKNNVIVKKVKRIIKYPEVLSQRIKSFLPAGRIRF